jgi:hypothetical protein
VDTTNRLSDGYAPRIPAACLIDPEGYIIARIKLDLTILILPDRSSFGDYSPIVIP